MSVKTTDIVKLRKATGAGMMDCKNALIDADGDFDKAIDIIRKKGMAIANKRADREASEGVVLTKTSDDNTLAAMVVLNCETDFVAKNQNFIDFANSILAKALETNPTDLEMLKNTKLDGNRTVEEMVTEQTGIIGEKIELSYYENIKSEYATTYIHMGNKLATMVGFNKVIDKQVAKDIAMQTAAMAPVAIDRDDVPKKVIDKELEIGKEKARLEGKPEHILDKIAQGRLNKFFIESTLVNQIFVKDNKKTIKQYLNEADKEARITHMKRFSLTS